MNPLYSAYKTFCSLVRYNQKDEDRFFNSIKSKSAQDLAQLNEKTHIQKYFTMYAGQLGDMNWKDVVATLNKNKNAKCFGDLSCEDMANKIHNFRGTFMGFITEKACVSNDGKCKTSCLSSGSADLTSDVDVTVKGNCMLTNLSLLTAVRKYLTEYFNFKPFYGDIAKISRFFDVNFYLSDFAILKDSNTTDVQKTQLESYYLTNDNKSQIQKILDNTKPHSKVVNNFEEYIGAVETANCALEQLQKDKNNQQLQNNFVNEISNIALFEDECYVSQGAFMHVVYMTQKKLPFHTTLTDTTGPIFLDFMICSMLENLNFAISHGGKSRGKYLMRVFDAENHRRELSGRDTVSEVLDKHFTKEYVDGVLNAIKIIQEVRYSKPLNKSDLEFFEQGIKNKLTQFDNRVHTIENTYNDLSVLQSTTYNIHGGRTGYRKLLDKANKAVKKDINGKSCVVYVDQDRCQYIKRNNQYLRLQEARKSVSKSTGSKATKRPQHKKPSSK